MSFRYEDRLHDPKMFPGYSNATSPSTSGRQSSNNAEDRTDRSGVSAEEEDREEEPPQADFSGEYIDPRLKERHKKVQFFAASQRITHVVLSITPSAVHSAEIVPPAELCFDLASLQHLLRDHAPKDLDDMVREGKPSALFHFATHLARLVRLEYSSTGLKYAIVGAFSEPSHETCGWPLDVPSYLDDDDEELEDLLVDDAGLKDEPEVKLESPVAKAMEIDIDPPEKEVVVETISEREEETQPPPPVEDMEIIVSPCPPTPPSPSPPVVEAPLPFLEPCPMHPALCSTANSEETCGCCVNLRSCKCAHQVVTLKGSEIMLWANFSRLEDTLSPADGEPEDSAATTAGAAYITSSISIPSTIEAHAVKAICVDRGCTLQVSNALRLVAVDQIDPSLMCEVVLSADKVTEILHQACGKAESGEDTESYGDEVEGLLRDYAVSSSSNVLCLDLMLHPALRRMCFDYICDSSTLDLFLSRKSKLIKLIVK